MMLTDSHTTQTAFEEWRRAEAEYAQAVSELGHDGAPTAVTQEAALTLAQLRYRADFLRHQYFSLALVTGKAS